MTAQGEAIARQGSVTLGVADYMLNGVGSDVFARQPADGRGGRIDCNHPAFVLGHLSLYPPKILSALECELGPAAAPETYAELFAPGVSCRDDPDGRIYPPMDSILAQFRAAHQTLLEILPALGDAQLEAVNPNETMRDRLGLKTVGDACAFVLTGHAQFHLGQLSTWRRAMGLGSAM